MTDVQPPPDTDDESTADGPPGTPRWVKAFGVIALVVILVVVILVFTGAHDPSRFGH